MRSHPVIVLSLVAVAAAALLAAGWGGRTSATPGKTTRTGVAAYAGCMRSHGVPSFPRPTSSGEIRKDKIVPLVGTPGFDAAQRACEHVMPAGGLGPQGTAAQAHARLADARSFAACMRGRGVTRFPDPNARGELSVEMVQARGIDVHSRAVLRVVGACLPASHGALTPARVSAALAKTGG